MAPLLNELTTIDDDFALVLDDYHVIDSEPIDKILNYLLDHLPQQMHVFMTTREDPDFPLARMRARGQLTELRVSDLQFTNDESSELLNNVMGLALSVDDIEMLGNRTEGWITGLQLAD